MAAKKKFRFVRFVVIIGLILILAAGIFCFSIITSPKVCAKAVMYFVNSQNFGFALSDLRIEKQDFRQFDQWQWQDVAFVVTQDNESYTVKLLKVSISGLKEIFKKSGNYSILFDQAGVKSKVLNIEKIDASFKIDGRQKDPGRINGHIQLKDAVFNGYHIDELKTDVVFNPDLISLNELDVKLYGGAIVGKMAIDQSESRNYVLDAQLLGISFDALSLDQGSFYSYFKGSVNGSAVIEGDAQNIKKITARIHAPSGGQMKASLLKYLLDYIPKKAQQYRDLEKIIAQDGLVPLEKASVEIASQEDEKLENKFTFQSKKFNLDANVTFEINVEGGLKNWMKALDQLRSL